MRLANQLASFMSPLLYYHQHYFGAIDTVVNSLKDRFEQPGYQCYSKLEQLRIKACQGKDFKEELEFVSSFYKDDIQDLLCTQLSTLAVNYQEMKKT